MFKFIFKTFFLCFLIFKPVCANEDFNKWLKEFQKKAIDSGISKKVVNEIMSDAKFLPKVI